MLKTARSKIWVDIRETGLKRCSAQLTIDRRKRGISHV
jgi:hypothetical protein